MGRVRLAWAAAAIVATGWIGTAPPARADDGADDRLRRVEDALRRQTEETERLRRDFDY
jgi:hypothetical protein